MTTMRGDLPTGTVTFLFTDVEGSTKLLYKLGAAAYAEALAEHRRLIREACAAHDGVEVDTQGDAFFVAFPTPAGALQAAQDAQAAFASGPIRVRMGIHTGTPLLTDEGYVGADVHKGARIAAAGHGGQVVLSKEAHELAHVEVTDLGEHRLKDLDGPVWIFQLGHDHYPPLMTISNTNLPRPASSFVGREREVGEVASLLQNGTRLLTLTGPGGSGKTRLAIEAAAELVPEFKAGVYWVGMASLRDPTLVTTTIGQTLGAKDGLAEHIAERELLLLLDNLEQVVEAAPELSSLLEVCPNLRLLVTSRELLRVRGEVEYAVPPLAELEAVNLFCARSQLHADATIAELCRRLDNLPLAVELAAARSSILAPKQILERLSGRLDLLKGGRDADPRQQTLRATIEWSHELLEPAEQRLFARLAVFRGGCRLEAAEEVTQADLDILQSLVDKNLLRHTDERFGMLETIREYAAERLEESGEAEDLRRRHAQHFLVLAEEAYPNLTGSPKAWLDRLEAEHDNLRAALDRLEASGETQLALRLAGALSRFWQLSGYVVESRRRLESALGTDERPTAARARALIGAGIMAGEGGDLATERLRAEEALALHRALGDAWGTAYSGHLLGYVALEEHDWARARQLFDECVRVFRELGDEHYTMVATFNLAWAYEELEGPANARPLHEDNLRRARALGNERIEALSLAVLAAFARDEGRVQDALVMLKDTLRISRDLGEPVEIADTLSRLAATLAVAGRGETAAQLLSSSMTTHERAGSKRFWVADRNEETLTTIRKQLGESVFAEAWEQGKSLTVDEAIALALDS